MFYLDEHQKKNIGLNYILEKLCANSPYGMEKIKNIKFYSIDDMNELMNELTNIKKIVDNYVKYKEYFDQVEFNLMKLKDIRNSLKKLDMHTLDEVELFEIKHFLLIFKELLINFEYLNEHINFVNINLWEMEEPLNILDPDGKRISSFYISELYSDKLKDIRILKRNLENKITKSKNSDEIENLKNERLKVVVLEEEEELKVKEQLTKLLKPFKEIFLKNIENIGNLDFSIRKAVLANELGGIFPKINDENKVYFKEAFNPEIEHILNKRGKDFTKISIELSKGTTLLTGANMGGKSVALKTFVLNIVLMHMGFFVFAKEASIPLFNYVYLISEDLQSISKGLSTFGAEIIKFNKIALDATKGNTFIALDEFARGTNPEEGAIIVKSVGEYLNSLNSISIMATHYDNVWECGFSHYQVVGLKNVDLKELKNKILLKGISSINLLSEYMDYNLEKVDANKSVPKDALNICRILSLNEDVLKIVESNYNKEENANDSK